MLGEKDLARLVRAMRSMQKRYFRDRTRGELQESKRLEAEVDRAVEAILSAPAQASLFEEGDV